MSSVASPSVSITDDDNDIREGEELFFLKGAWERVLDQCQYVYTPPDDQKVPSAEPQAFFVGNYDGHSAPLTESRKKEIGWCGCAIVLLVLFCRT